MLTLETIVLTPLVSAISCALATIYLALRKHSQMHLNLLEKTARALKLGLQAKRSLMHLISLKNIYVH